MKTSKNHINTKLLLAFLLLAFFSCDNRDWDNPFDPDCPKELFTPSDFKAVQEGPEVKLTWNQTNTKISGFLVEESMDGIVWTIAATPGKNETTWNDNSIQAGKKHHYRIVAKAGQNSSNERTVEVTPVFAATLTTSAVTALTTNSATSGGNITSDGGAPVTARGVCWSTSPNPTTANSKTSDGTGTGSFTSNLTALTENTTYYVRSYAINSQGTAYGTEVSFKTNQTLSLATVTTTAVTTFTETTAVLGGNVTNDGNAEVTERGIVYATTQNPTTANTKVILGTGTGIFGNSVPGFESNTIYYVRAYAINSQGTSYGSEVSFKTNPILALATVTTTAVTIFTTTTAVLGGNVTSDGNATVTERGVVYATTQNPTTSNTKVTMGTGTGIFSNTVTGLTANTTYYIRAYAINSQGTSYGSEVSFKTYPILAMATVTTTAVTTFTTTNAVLGGNVTSDGNATVTERGVVYATTQNPTTSNTKVTMGTGTGSFSNTVTGLTANTTYYVRAYAINSQGTAYGSEVSFKTSQTLTLATVTTTAITTFTLTTAVMGGNVTNDGNAAVTERGVVYSTSQNPTTSNSKLTIGTGTGSFSNTVTGLTANTTYYVRAYAINSQGTAYGSEVSFKTSDNFIIEMITVQGGTFQMGSTTGDSDEKPVHTVTLSSYSIGKTEVTQAQWVAIMGSNPSSFKGDNLPVEKVSWNDVQTFITKLNQQTGGNYRLPTEAEWEYAARGGNSSKGYEYAGSNTIGDVAWYLSNSSSKTHPVATKQANELGLYDMSGNVWEWCSDWYGTYPTTSQTNPTGAATGSDRVIRGGSWYYDANICRSAYRDYINPDGNRNYVGFRVVLVP
jgi:formylglycine-generating enzyme required for sulfatase activity